MTHEARMLLLASRLALRGAGKVEPNPLVGCVIEKNGRIIGMGHHRRLGGLHAETDALRRARELGHDPRGATMYVTLEPCSTAGRQPPCTDAILQAGIARVVYACPDPHPTKGGGAARLRASGVICEICTECAAATRLSDPFVHRLRTGLPWVIAKWAQTIDGRVATRTGDSKWISAEPARRRVHQLRSRVDAILTGIGTVLADDPMLNARLGRAPSRVAARVVVDSDLRTPLDSRLVRSARDLPLYLACERSLSCTTYTAKTRAALDQAGVHIIPVADQGTGGGLDLRELLRILARDHSCSTVLVEAGPGLLGSFFAENLVNEAIVYVAPMLLGDEQARSVGAGRVADKLSSAYRFELLRSRRVGPDVELVFQRPERGEAGAVA